MTSFADDIRPLFIQEDIEHMLRVDRNLNLGNYDAVKARANDIYLQVSFKNMPPGRPWAQDHVDMFKKWMDENYPP
jgi:hypothetical protein